jgi:hypothetical protein
VTLSAGGLWQFAQTTTSGPDTFLHLGSTAWTAISALASIVYDFLTLALVIFAVTQIVLARRDARINRTLAACEKYDFDPVLDAICRRLAAARESGDLKNNPQDHRLDLYSILNYMESIAIGVQRGLYSNSVVRAHMEPIFVGCIEEYINSGIVTRAAPAHPVGGAISVGEDYDKMIALVKRWNTPPWYKRWFHVS